MIKFDKISKLFSDQLVVNQFSLEVLEGEKVCFDGRSGIGKTTIFKLLLGFESLSSGDIYFKGNLLDEKTVWQVRQEVAYISQDLNIGTGKVKDFFFNTLTLKVNQKHKAYFHKNMQSFLHQFELSDTILEKNIEDVSGGEKQRIAIINALLLQRKIFLLDEISSALDKKLRLKVMDYFLKNPLFTVLYISHDKYIPEEVEVKHVKFI